MFELEDPGHKTPLPCVSAKTMEMSRDFDIHFLICKTEIALNIILRWEEIGMGGFRSSHEWPFYNCHLSLECIAPNTLDISFIMFLWIMSPCGGLTACNVLPNRLPWVLLEESLVPSPSYRISCRTMGCSHGRCCWQRGRKGKACDKPWFPERTREEVYVCSLGVLAWWCPPKYVTQNLWI